MKFRTEAERYRPKGKRLSAAMRWPAIFGGFQRELAPAGALLVTERELVLISEEISNLPANTREMSTGLGESSRISLSPG